MAIWRKIRQRSPFNDAIEPRRIKSKKPVEFVFAGDRNQFLRVGGGMMNQIAIKEQLQCERTPMISVGNQVASRVNVEFSLLEEICKIGCKFSQPPGALHVSPYPRQYRS